MIFYILIIFSLFIPFLYTFIIKKSKKIFRFLYYIIRKIFNRFFINKNSNNNNNNNLTENKEKKISDCLDENNEFLPIQFEDEYPVPDYRFIIFNYLSNLRDHRRSKIEQFIWKKLEYYLPENLKYINQENGFNYPLPNWIEYILQIYTHPYICKIIMSLLIFIVLILFSNLWIGLIIDIDLVDNTLNLNNNKFIILNGKNVTMCLNYNNNHHQQKKEEEEGEDIISYCIIKNNSLWLKSIDIPYSLCLSNSNSDYNYQKCLKQQQKKIFIKINESNNNYSYHRKNNYYYKYYDLIEKKDKLINKINLIEKLEEVRNNDPIPCICPSYINIIGNYSFLYNDIDQEWIILFKPFLSRNNTFSDLKKSSITYDNNTNQFYRYEYIKNLINYTIDDEQYIHYESFIITSIYNNDDNNNNNDYDNNNNKIIDNNKDEEEYEYDINKNIKDFENKEENILLKMIKINSDKIIKRTLKESDAICFIHCENINKKMIY